MHHMTFLLQVASLRINQGRKCDGMIAKELVSESNNSKKMIRYAMYSEKKKSSISNEKNLFNVHELLTVLSEDIHLFSLEFFMLVTIIKNYFFFRFSLKKSKSHILSCKRLFERL